MCRKVAFHNLGCKVNAYETEAMQQLLADAGYVFVPFEPGADIYIINTCTVTNIADRKSRQMLHKARKMNPQAIVIAVGCYVQTDTETLIKDKAVDLLVGNNQKLNIVEIIDQYQQSREAVHVIPIHKDRNYEPLNISRTAEHVRAYMKVQDGCNQFCTYCIIPYARGRVRSRSMEDVISEANRLAEAGYKEIVLTGIHLSSYGVDLGPDDDLLSLIRHVSEVEGIRRIRLGSLEPGIITEDFVRELRSIPEVCPHFHLSLQSGCNDTLARMNRRYTADEYRDRCCILRRYYENPALTTDVIVGFPMESQSDFDKSYAFVDEIGFYETHIFKYSRRRGTKAAQMRGQLTEAQKAERSDRLLSLNEDHSEKYEASFMGKPLEILLEEKVEINGRLYYQGYSREYIKAALPAADDSLHINDIVTLTPNTFLTPHLLYHSED